MALRSVAHRQPAIRSTAARVVGLRSWVAVSILWLWLVSSLSIDDARAFRHGPEWLDPNDPIYRDLRTLVLEGSMPPRVWTLRPRTRMEIARLIAESSDREPNDRAPYDRGSSARLRVEREFAAELEEIGHSTATPPIRAAAEIPAGAGAIELRPYVWLDGVWEEGEVDLGESARVGLRGTAHLSPRFTLHENLFAGEVTGGRTFADALINHTDILLFLDEVYAGYAGPVASARLGRMRQSWGVPAGGTLLLDGQAPPVDQLEIELALGQRVRFRSILGVLQAGAEKNLAAHRLDWSPTSAWTFGLSEGAIFRGSPLQPLYALGLVPYTIVERLHGQDENTAQGDEQNRNNVLYQFDVMRGGSRHAIWGSLLLDDVGTETADTPSRIGFVAGGEWLLSRPRNLRIGLEGAKVYNHTYSVYYQNSDWSHQGEPLGYPLGPDVERLHITARWQPAVRWGVDGLVHLTRHGEGRVGVPWYPPGDPRSAGNPDTPTAELSGIVEERWGGGIGLRFEPSAALLCQIETKLDWIRNRDHRPHERTPHASLRAQVRWHR
jgi:hypothetical protein